MCSTSACALRQAVEAVNQGGKLRRLAVCSSEVAGRVTVLARCGMRMARDPLLVWVAPVPSDGYLSRGSREARDYCQPSCGIDRDLSQHRACPSRGFRGDVIITSSVVQWRQHIRTFRHGRVGKWLAGPRYDSTLGNLAFPLHIPRSASLFMSAAMVAKF